MKSLDHLFLITGTLLLFKVGVSVKLSEVNYGVDLCDKPSTDPCVPGGKWDPLLKRCQGIRGQNCYQCYSGQFCQEVNSLEDCLLQSLDGDPVVLSEYWSTVGTSKTPCLKTPADYRPAYQFEVLPPVEEAIKQLHATINNADTEGYSIVYGVGATNILYMTITAMSRNILNVSTFIGFNYKDVHTYNV